MVSIDRPQRSKRKRKVVGKLFATFAALVATTFVSSLIYDAVEDRSAQMTTTGPYTATQESLNGHLVPEWFEDAKFGVFIHWGLFSVPGYAPKGSFTKTLKTDYDRAMLVHPYAEDYWNAIKDPTTPSAAYHRAQYGDVSYQELKARFNDGLRAWDPDAWAQSFRHAGARYVVIVAKYHDGFSLWPTNVPHPHEPNWHSERDIVGELATAVRKEGLRFGIYYSGGIDWSFNRAIVRTLGDYAYSTPGGDYPAYADAQVRELIARYKPDILWNDIAWATGERRLFSLFADYYNTVPEGVVNDRWQTVHLANWLMRAKPARRAFDFGMKLVIRAKPEVVTEITPPLVPHSDYTTPEYTQYPTIQAKKWETTRGIGNSYGYNRNEAELDYATFERLGTDFIDAVAKNGNLLLNVGPRGEDAQIPPEQLARLHRFGDWLRPNGEAIYGTRPWTQAEAVTETGLPVRFTQRGQELYLVVVGQPTGSQVRIKDVQLSGTARLLADGSAVRLAQDGADLLLSFDQPLTGRFSPAIGINVAPATAR